MFGHTTLGPFISFQKDEDVKIISKELLEQEGIFSFMVIRSGELVETMKQRLNITECAGIITTIYFNKVFKA